MRKQNATAKRPNGKLILTQKPNLPIVLFLVFGLVSLLCIGHPLLFLILALLSLGSLIVWAILELVSGINSFRKVLGLLGLLLALLSVVVLLRAW